MQWITATEKDTASAVQHVSILVPEKSFDWELTYCFFENRRCVLNWSNYPMELLSRIFVQSWLQRKISISSPKNYAINCESG